MKSVEGRRAKSEPQYPPAQVAASQHRPLSRFATAWRAAACDHRGVLRAAKAQRRLEDVLHPQPRLPRALLAPPLAYVVVLVGAFGGGVVIVLGPKAHVAVGVGQLAHSRSAVLQLLKRPDALADTAQDNYALMRCPRADAVPPGSYTRASTVPPSLRKRSSQRTPSLFADVSLGIV